MTLKRFITACLISTSLILPQVSYAQGSNNGLYIGAALGWADIKPKRINIINMSDGDLSPSLSTTLYTGYDFNHIFALELSATQISAKSKQQDNDLNKINIVNYILTPKWTIPLDDMFSISLKTGLSYSEADYEYHHDYNKEHLYYLSYVLGAGANFTLTPNIRVHVNFEYLEDITNSATFGLIEGISISQWSLGIDYQF
ncbi:porin family protein [uncultured Shewanella sp.]|uniref:porin family protein n=1 Tax=uncultured Shewanella sp. TaxID=173975 RepID=UPI00261E99F4|nr:porin family protein [uncultured Shewanella sp.]